MNASRFLFFFTALLFCAAPLLAQTPTATLTGRVVEAETGQPVPGAHVFIAVSMIGTTTDTDGRYRLERVPIGAHRLYVSIVGFEPQPKDVMLREPTVYVFDFTLEESVVELGEVTVEAERDEKWLRQLEKFTGLFIGETPNAGVTEILNPEVLSFEEKVGFFRATASAPLIIENRALGYKVQYFLKEFEATSNRTRYDGEPLYEELEPTSPVQAAEWEAKRREAFMGSFRHFLLASLAGKVQEQGFETYSRPSSRSNLASTAISPQESMGSQRFPLDMQEVIKPGEAPTEKLLDFHGFVEIIYQGEMEDQSYLDWQRGPVRRRPGFQKSWINLERGPTVLDYKGDVLDPYGVTLYGYLAFERVADEVPKEYRPAR